MSAMAWIAAILGGWIVVSIAVAVIVCRILAFGNSNDLAEVEASSAS